MKNKKVIVTGAGGFIGSHLCEMLLENDNEVIAIDSYEYGKNNNLNHIKERLVLIERRVQDINWLQLLKDNTIDAIFNLASLNMNISMIDPILDLRTNVEGILAILEAIRKHSLDIPIIHSSTGSVYGEPINQTQNEDHPKNPTSPYGVSKLSAENYLQLYYLLYRQKFVGLRYYNIYGPRQYDGETGGVIPIFINNALYDREFTITGDGEQARCFTYVKDIASVNLRAFEINKSGFYNVAHNTITNINELAKTILYITNKDLPIRHIEERLGEILRFNPDTTMLNVDFNLGCETTLKEGLEITIEYYKNKEM